MLRTSKSSVSNALSCTEESAATWVVVSAATSAVLRPAINAVDNDRIWVVVREEIIEVI